MSVLPGATLDSVRDAARPLIDGEAGDYDALLKLIADARLVLLGVPSYGTHEFFHARGEVTKRLIQDRGFTRLSIAADPAAVQPIDDFVKGRSADRLAADALAELTVFPRWTWRNAEMLDFVGWLRSFNDQFSGDTHKVSVCGIDVDRALNTVIWEHSRNVGDSRATDSDSPSLGQVARDRHGRRAFLVGFTTYTGTIVAAAEQDASAHRLRLDPPPADSVETVCHAVALPRFQLFLRGASDGLAQSLREPLLERMLDAVYPRTSGYLRARLADQFDALIHFDETRSLEPLDTTF
ncbi:MAG TPA: erythromycin esterase family protein [Chloroflexota bacterium]|jgi:erythromycin esterase-like protein|nr:erythromycin esterase family protein [Chloroflexota bacterium]